MRHFFSFAVLSFAALLPPLHAQTQTTLSTDGLAASEAVWQLHVNINKFFASPLGSLLNEVIKAEAPDGQVNIDAFVEALGFDPRTNIQEVVIFGDDFNHTSATAIANLGSNRGNIEGWLLAAPGYKSEPMGNTIVHSIDVDKEEIPRLWCAIPQQPGNKNYVLVVGFDADRVRSLVTALGHTDSAAMTDKLPGNTFLSLAVTDLSKAPIEIDEDEPGSAIIKTLQSIVLSMGSEGNQLTSSCEITTDNPARAQQLNQLIMGMKAMVQLALPEKKPEAKELAKYLNNLKVEYTEGSPTLSANFAMDYDAIRDLVKMKHNID